MNILNYITAMWNKLSLMQRAVIVAAVMACALVSILLTGWATQPDMRLLYSGLDLDEAAKITEKLSEKSIQFEIRGDGSTIYVPDNKIYSARMELAREGLPSSDQGGYKIFENTKISASPLVQKMNHKQALEEELAKSIQMITGIEFAKVLVVSPEQTLFNQAENKAKASITVKLKPGWHLNQANIAAITNLASSAIEGLSPTNVTIVDSSGKLLSTKDDDDGFAPGANSLQDYKNRVEHSLASKAQEMLEMVLGPGRSTVKVSAELDMKTTTTETIKYDSKGVPTKETINSTTKIKNSPTQTSANNEDNNTTAQQTSTEKEEQNETEMLVGKVITSMTDVPGKINSLSVAVVVDLAMPETLVAAPPVSGTEEETTKPETKTPQKIMTIEQVKEIIKNALGRELIKDENSLTVVDAPFVQTRMMSLPSPEIAANVKFDKYIELIRNSSMPIMGLFAFLTLLIFGRPSKKKEIKKQPTEESPMTLPQKDIEALLPGITQLDNPEVAFRQHISKTLENNPEEVKQVFTAWLREDG